MRNFVILLFFSVIAMSVNADTYNYQFRHEVLSDALTRIAEEHLDVNINMIYKELNKYYTTADIKTDNIYEALQKTIGMNPVSLYRKGDTFYIEALQHGIYQYSGQVVEINGEPIAGASVFLLQPKDSTVITYGVTETNGRFSIPCDYRHVIVKAYSIGYKTAYLDCSNFHAGKIVLKDQPIKINSVNVVADNTILKTEKNTFIPTKQQKNGSLDATDLLARMAIPSILITDGSVKDVFGNSVEIYINFHKAQEGELTGMRMTDVKKVEYYEYPSDPRFDGAEKVINFVVQEYEYGGYTKLFASDAILNGFFNNSNFYSKFTYKKMTYDLYVGSNNQNFHHSGTDIEGKLSLGDENNPVTVTRSQIFDESYRKIDRFPVTFRASYITDKFSTINSINYTHNNNSRNETSGRLEIDDNAGNDYLYSSSSPSRYNNIYYQGSFWGKIGNNFAFSFDPNFNYTHRNNLSFYESSISSPIDYAIRENAINSGFQLTGWYKLSDNGNLRFGLNGSLESNKVSYSGSTNYDDSYKTVNANGLIGYSHMNKKISLNLWARLAYLKTNVPGNDDAEWKPSAGISSRFQIGNKNQINASISYYPINPFSNFMSEAIIKNYEYMYSTGNPNLYVQDHISVQFTYNRFQNNSLSFAIYSGYNIDFNRIATIYSRYDDGKALIRSYINSGNWSDFYAGSNITWRLLDKNLQLSAVLNFHDYRTTGIYRNHQDQMILNLQATYYLGAFSFGGSWYNRQKKLTENSNIISNKRSGYGIFVNWGNGKWVLRLSAINFFRTDWRSETLYRTTPLYNELQTIYDPSVKANIAFTATYTFGYGKKIMRGNEVGEGTSVRSAILE